MNNKQKAKWIAKSIIISLIILLIITSIVVGNKILNKNNPDTLEEYFGEIEKYEKPLYTCEPRENTAPPIQFENKPNTDCVFDGSQIRINPTHIKINSDGLRDDEYNINKSNNTFRIIILGDSFTFGLGVELKDTYAKVLEKKLNKLSKKTKYEVINFGTIGYNAKQEVELFKLKGIKYNPDLIIIGFLDNDDQDYEFEHSLRAEINENEYLRTKYNISLDDELTICLAVNEIREKYLESISFEENWKKSVTEPYTELGDIAKSINSEVLIFALAISEDQIPEQIPALKDFISKTERWHLAITSIHHTDKEFYIHKLDGHPNKKAHSIYAEEILDALILNKLIPNS